MWVVRAVCARTQEVLTTDHIRYGLHPVASFLDLQRKFTQLVGEQDGGRQAADALSSSSSNLISQTPQSGIVNTHGLYFCLAYL